MKKLLIALGLGAAILVAVLAMTGFFTEKIVPGEGARAAMQEWDGPEVRAVKQAVTEHYEAVGTVRPITETSVEAQVTARVNAVKVRSGDRVERGETLIILDDRALASRVDAAEEGLSAAKSSRQQAQEAVASAEAAFAKVETTYKRHKSLHEQGAIATEELELVETDYLRAKAALEQAKEGLSAAEAGVRQAMDNVDQARINLGYATISAQEAGEISRRSVEPGDLAFPGKSLLLIQTGGSLRLEALVREGLIARARSGAELEVVIPALDARTTGVVDEVVPSADPATRSFLVKVILPDMPGMYPGMFGRLFIPMGERQAVVAPREAVRRVGQLDTVLVKELDGWRSVFVRTGQERGGMIEILSGLDGGETLAARRAP